MFVREAPKTFRIPISFVRWDAVYDDKPINPRHETIIASTVNIPIILPNRVSSLYWRLYLSSKKEYSNEFPGKNFLYISSISATVFARSFVLTLTDVGE